MKRKIIIFTILLVIENFIFGNEFNVKKITEFPMGTKNEGIYLRKYEEVAPSDDITKNYLIFTNDGNLCIYQADTSRMIYLDEKLKINKELKMNLLIGPYDFMYTDNYLLMSDKSGRIYLFDMELNRKAYFETFDVLDTNNTSIWLGETYYDETTDIIFFRDSKQNLHSLLHPCLNKEENKKNYKTPEETLNLFNKDNTYFDANHLSLYKNKYLIIDGITNYWGRKSLGKYTYQIVNLYFVNLWDGKKSLPIKLDDIDGDIESIAIHPSGDIYILRMNLKTNTHNLYYIVNTSDPQSREQWYNK